MWILFCMNWCPMLPQLCFCLQLHATSLIMGGSVWFQKGSGSDGEGFGSYDSSYSFFSLEFTYNYSIPAVQFEFSVH